jgi:hypothetical protein
MALVPLLILGAVLLMPLILIVAMLRLVLHLAILPIRIAGAMLGGVGRLVGGIPLLAVLIVTVVLAAVAIPFSCSARRCSSCSPSCSPSS